MAQYPALIALSELDETTGFRFVGESEYSFSGRSVSSAGDVNGDGFDDIIIGAYGDSSTAVAAGSSYVVFGAEGGFDPDLDLLGLDGSNGFKLTGGAKGDNSGQSVSAAGDVNGDGIDDIIIGANNADPHSASSGASYVVFGREGDFDATMSLNSLDGMNGFRLAGVAANDQNGWSVSSAGDVNGDGIDDVLVGARNAGLDGIYSGTSYVVFGKIGGFGETVELGGLDGSDGFRLAGPGAYAASGWSVSSAGDVDGDGIDDILVGAHGAGGTGAAYVVFGKQEGFADTLVLKDLDGSDGFAVIGRGDATGFSVSSAGDVNGDGIDDIIVGAPNASVGSSNSGSSYVVFGSKAGFDAQLDVSALDGENGFEIDGVSSGDSSGVSVASAGDVNGDGFDDIIVGAFGVENGTGSAYVVFGKDGGFSATLALSGLDGTNGFEIAGEVEKTYTGVSVSSAGDVNGDGFDDLLVGATRSSSGGTYSGASYVIYGRAPDGPVSRVGSIADQTIRGGAFADTLDGGGGRDTLIGGAGNDTYIVDTSGKNSDTIIENESGGTDTVKSSVSNSIQSVDSVENLRTTNDAGTASIDLTGNDFANKIAGNAGANILDGKQGADIMAGYGGNDTYIVDERSDIVHEQVGRGIDTIKASVDYSLRTGLYVENLRTTDDTDDSAINLFGNAFANKVAGNAGSNFLHGGAGNDVLAGYAGNDVLVGGLGADALYGGGRIAGGDDVFVFNGTAESGVTAKTRDTIVDFGDGDVIDLSNIDADTEAGGHQFFTLADGTFLAGEIRQTVSGSDLLLEFNTDGDDAAEMSILLRNHGLVDSGDFLVMTA